MTLPLGATGSHASWAGLAFVTVYKSVFCSGQLDAIDQGNGRGFGGTVNYVDADGVWHGDEHIEEGCGLFDASLWDPANPIRQAFAHPVLLAGTADAAALAVLNQYFWWAATGKVDEQLPPQTQPAPAPGSPDGGVGNAPTGSPAPPAEPAPPAQTVKKKKRHQGVLAEGETADAGDNGEDTEPADTATEE